MKTIQLEELDHNVLGYAGEIFLEDDRLIADVFIRQSYKITYGGYDYPEEIEYGNLEFNVNSIYFIADKGKQINVFSREMEDFVKDSINIEH